MRSRVASRNWRLSNSPCLPCSYVTNTSTQHTHEPLSANSRATSTVLSALPHPPYETPGSRSVIPSPTTERNPWSRVRVCLSTNPLHQPQRLPELSLLPVELVPTNEGGGPLPGELVLCVEWNEELIRGERGLGMDASGTVFDLCISVFNRGGGGDRGGLFFFFFFVNPLPLLLLSLVLLVLRASFVISPLF